MESLNKKSVLGFSAVTILNDLRFENSFKEGFFVFKEPKSKSGAEASDGVVDKEKVNPGDIAISETYKKSVIERAKLLKDSVVDSTKKKLSAFKEMFVASQIATQFSEFLKFEAKGLEFSASDFKDGKFTDESRAKLTKAIDEIVSSKEGVSDLTVLFKNVDGFNELKDKAESGVVSSVIAAFAENSIEEKLATYKEVGEKVRINIDSSFSVKVENLDKDDKAIEKKDDAKKEGGKDSKDKASKGKDDDKKKPKTDKEKAAAASKEKAEKEAAAEKVDIDAQKKDILKKLKKGGIIGMVFAMVLGSKSEKDGPTLLDKVFNDDSPFIAGALGSLGIGKFKKNWDEFKDGAKDNKKMMGFVTSWEKMVAKVKKKINPEVKELSEKEKKSLIKLKSADLLKQLDKGELARGVTKAFVLEDTWKVGAKDKAVKVILPKEAGLTIAEGKSYIVSDSLTGKFPAKSAKKGEVLPGKGKEGEKVLYFKLLPEGTVFPKGVKIEKVK